MTSNEQMSYEEVWSEALDLIAKLPGLEIKASLDPVSDDPDGSVNQRAALGWSRQLLGSPAELKVFDISFGRVDGADKVSEEFALVRAISEQQAGRQNICKDEFTAAVAESLTRAHRIRLTHRLLEKGHDLHKFSSDTLPVRRFCIFLARNALHMDTSLYEYRAGQPFTWM